MSYPKTRKAAEKKKYQRTRLRPWGVRYRWYQCAWEVEDLLDKVPDAWRPIADAPRDGREIVGWIKKQWQNNEKFIKWNSNKRIWVDREFFEWEDNSFSHYREKPAPPREE